MVYSVILLVPRKPSVAWVDFKHYWETQHVPLLERLVGPDFPLSHTRHYLEQTDNDQPNVSVGSSEGINYDGLAVLTFADREHHARFMAKMQDKEAHELHEQDLHKFVDVKMLKGFTAGATLATGRRGKDVGWRFVGSV